MPFLFSFQSPGYIEKNINSRATLSPHNMNLLRHFGIFSFENFYPDNELCWDRHFCCWLYYAFAFPPWLLPLGPLHTQLWLLLLSWGSWECHFCRDFIVWECEPLSLSIPLPLHLHCLWFWDRVLVCSPGWTQTHHVPASFSWRLGILAHTIITIWFACNKLLLPSFPSKNMSSCSASGNQSSKYSLENVMGVLWLERSWPKAHWGFKSCMNTTHTCFCKVSPFTGGNIYVFGSHSYANEDWDKMSYEWLWLFLF